MLSSDGCERRLLSARQTQPSRRAVCARHARSPVVSPRNGSQICVAVRLRRLRRLHVVDAPGDDTVEGHRQGEERVRDAGIAPVEEQVAVVAHEDLGVVQIVVLDRLREPRSGELVARLANPGHRRPEPAPFLVGLFHDLDRGPPRASRATTRAGSRARRRRAAPARRPSDRSGRLHRAGARRSSGSGRARSRSARGASARRPPSASSPGRCRPRAEAGCSRAGAPRGAR